MRLIQLRVPDPERDGVTAVLEDRDLDYVVTTEERGEGTAALVQFPLPAAAVDEVLAELESAGLAPEEYTVVTSVETTRVDQSEPDDAPEDRIGHDELRDRAVGMNPGVVTYYAMTVLSAVVATAGLLLDSPAIVVGSMVIAPQVGSALTASVGTALNDRALLTDGLRDQVVGLTVAVVTATLFGLLLRYGGVVPAQLRVTTVQQIASRISPGFLSMAVGICAGAAGAFGLATALPVSLVGVMIAAALIPAAAAVGVGIAFGLPAVALGAGILLLVNLASVNLAGFLVLWWLDFRPETWDDGRPDLETVRTHASTIVVVSLLLVAFVGASVVTAGQVQVETAVNDAVTEVLERPAYEELRLLSVQTRFGGVSVYRLDREVTVEVSRPDGRSYPALAGALADRIRRAIDEEATVQVSFSDRSATV